MEATKTQSSPTLTAAAPPPASSQSQKLKDSCDNCSSSKVRCTKEKPSCARCEKSGYTCFYSPARRVGRPYRSREASSVEKKDEEAELLPSTRAIKVTRFADEGDRSFSRSTASSTHVDASRNSFIADPGPSRQNTSFGTQEPEDNPAEKHKHTVEPDCVLVAMDLFSELEVPAEQLRRSCPVNSNLLNSTAQTITAVIRRLFTILVCPCAERAEIGMLIYAISMTIIDIHAMTIVKSIHHKTPPVMLDQTRLWDDPEAMVQGSLEKEAVTMRVLGGLSKVAKLVLQFTQRYSGDAEGKKVIHEDKDILPDFLPELGNHMRERLQQITNDATYWLG